MAKYFKLAYESNFFHINKCTFDLEIKTFAKCNFAFDGYLVRGFKQSSTGSSKLSRKRKNQTCSCCVEITVIADKSRKEVRHLLGQWVNYNLSTVAHTLDKLRLHDGI